MPNRILRKGCALVAERIACQVVVRDLPQGLNLEVTDVLNTVETFFELPPSLLFSKLCKGLAS